MKRRSTAKGRGGIRTAFVLGAGKVGSALARSLGAADVRVTLRPMRRGLPTRPIDADLLVLALRDRDLSPIAERIRAARLVGHRRIAIVHCAGALGPEVLAPLRSLGPNVAVAQMHPMISFASVRKSPSLSRGQLHVDGDVRAVRAARSVGRLLGMTPRTIRALDRVAYHAAAGLVANGAAALAAAGIELLGKAGVDRATAAAMLGPLLRSVADNVERMGMPDALTGPVRRGDRAGVERHLETLARSSPELVPLYRACGLAQIPHARALGEAEPGALDAIERLLRAQQV